MLRSIMFSLIFAGFGYAEPLAVYFDTDKDLVKLSELNKIIDAAEHVKKAGGKVVLAGHADKRGSYEYNFALASKRVLAVRNALVESGVDSRQIIIEVSNGKLTPKAPDDNNPAHLQINRRVDIVCLDPEVVTKTVIKTDIYPVRVNVEKLLVRRHRVSLLGGFAPSGLNLPKSNTPKTSIITQDYDWEAGVGYQFLTPWLDNRLSFGANGYTNKSGFISVGLDF